MDELQEALRTGTGRRDRVERTVTAYLDAIERDPQVYRFLVHAGADLGAAQRVRSFTRALASRLAEGIGQETGVVPARAQVWAQGIVGMVREAGDWWLAAAGSGPRPSAAELGRELADLLFGASATA